MIKNNSAVQKTRIWCLKSCQQATAVVSKSVIQTSYFYYDYEHGTMILTPEQAYEQYYNLVESRSTSTIIT